jgi:hypothetical protein
MKYPELTHESKTSSYPLTNFSIQSASLQPTWNESWLTWPPHRWISMQKEWTLMQANWLVTLILSVDSTRTYDSWFYNDLRNFQLIILNYLSEFELKEFGNKTTAMQFTSFSKFYSFGGSLTHIPHSHYQSTCPFDRQQMFIYFILFLNF